MPQTSPVVVCVQNIMISIRNTSLYWSQPSSVDFACKTATLAPEFQVSIIPSPHLWFLHAKQRLLDQNHKSPMVPDPTCRFCMQNSVISTRITSLYGPQTSPTVFCIQNSDFSTGITSLYGSQPSSVVFACKTATLGPVLQVSMGTRPHLSFVHAKQRD